ncbi:MAG: fibronectin type III domain-containing, partial [Geobacteraceae bacterium]
MSAAVTITDATAPTVTAFTMPATATSLTVSVSSFTATDAGGVTGYLITESATAPLAGDAGWTGTAPTTFTFSGYGARTAYAWAKDAAGNVSASLSASVTINDVIAPAVTAFTMPTTATSLTVNVTAFTASDNVAVTGYLITESATAPLAGDAGWTGTAPANFTFSGYGARTAYAWAKDAAGNVSSSLSATVTITDATAPTVTAFTMPATATSLTVSVTAFTATGAGGVTGYLITESATAPLAGDAGWTGTTPTTLTFSGYGARTAYAWAKDAAGNVSTSLSATVTITDATAPTVTAFTMPATATSLTVNVTSFTATDNLAVTGYLVTESATAPLAGDAGWSGTVPTTFTFSGYGAKTAYVWAKDAAGNVSTSLSASVTITDVTAPTVTAFSMPATATSLTVSVTAFTATDAGGVTGYLITESATAPLAGDAGWTGTAPTTFTFSGYGSKTAYAWAKDAAGNVSASLSANVTINDVTAPTVTAFSMPATATSLTVNVTSFTATDNLAVTGYLITESATAPLAGHAGWTGTAPTTFTFSGYGAKTAYAWAKDAAGNVSASLSASVTITDVTAPTVTAFTMPATATSLTVSVTAFTATDAGGVTGYLITESATAPLAGDAGWSGTVPTTFTFSGYGAKTAYAWAKDAAGNVSASLSANV